MSKPGTDPGFRPEDNLRGFRDALGRFATGVTVVTTTSEEGPVGIVANSFASVSLNPPLVLWSPDKASRRFSYFDKAPHFAIHVLDAHQQQICNGFTKDRHAFDGLDWETGFGDIPLISGCLARFECELDVTHDAGDHLIIVGRVRKVSHRDGLPLLFQAGRFVSLKG